MVDACTLVTSLNTDQRNVDVYTCITCCYACKGKIPTTILSFVSYPGAYTGMNHNGLSMSININGCPILEGKKKSDYIFNLQSISDNAVNKNIKN